MAEPITLHAPPLPHTHARASSAMTPGWRVHAHNNPTCKTRSITPCDHSAGVRNPAIFLSTSTSLMKASPPPLRLNNCVFVIIIIIIIKDR